MLYVYLIACDGKLCLDCLNIRLSRIELYNDLLVAMIGLHMTHSWQT
jgi:hypothetical protein